MMPSVDMKKMKFFGYRKVMGFYSSYALTEENEKMFGCSFVFLNNPFLNLIWTNGYWYDEEGKTMNFVFDDGNLYLRKLVIGRNVNQRKEE